MFYILYGFFLLTGLLGLIFGSGSVLFDLLILLVSGGGLLFAIFFKKKVDRTTRTTFCSVLLVILLGLALASGAGTGSPDNAPALTLNEQVGEARSYLEKGKTERASEILEELALSHPNSDLVNLHRALVFLQSGDADSAASVLGVVSNTGSAGYRYLLGAVRFLQGDHSRALLNLEAAVAADGDRYEALLFAGVLNLALSDLPDGEALLSQAAALQPDAQFPRYYQALIAYDRLNMDRAQQLFNQLKAEELPEAMRANVNAYLNGDTSGVTDPLLLELLAEHCLQGLPL
ncbi:MAG: tetratricopeptide repeat protein [Clostridiales bacterium]|nr:tetratricopeptide repeat protein [Clostridiales bacterium]